MKTADREPDTAAPDATNLSPLGESVSDTIRRECADPEFRREWARLGVAEQVAQALIRFRGERALTQKAAARLLRMTEPMVSRLERGDHVPNVDTMLRVAEATGTVLHVEFVPKDKSA